MASPRRSTPSTFNCGVRSSPRKPRKSSPPELLSLFSGRRRLRRSTGPD
nr:hypothetical protein I308_01961 [Cryptococcus tetragattii IND107]